ncbi:MAG: DinB family protein [Gammaproteobacteria bacterium]|nr:DinB family protein [Gammaproteobacteria bacterium]
MNIIDTLRLQASYNHWMNERLYAVCAALSDAERKRDLGAFFRSIHGTFNHILLADRLWLARLGGQPFHVASLDQELYADFDTLHAEQVRTDAEVVACVQDLAPERLADTVAYTSVMTGRPNALPLGVVLTHLFHHQTHHRGQITTLISQLGRDFGETDMIWMPGVGAPPT